MSSLRHALVAAALTAGLAPAAAAQPRPQPSTPQPPPRPRAVQVMTLTSPAWTDGGRIPDRHAQPGRDVSPPLEWRGAPEGTESFVLVVRDLDEIVPATGAPRLHWLVWNLPAASSSLPAGVPEGNAPEPPRGPGAPRRPPERLRQMSATGPAYRGPAAPASGPSHHYVFELYALDTWVDVPAVGQSPAATQAAVEAALAGHVRGKGVLVVTWRRAAPPEP
ncbi:MAG: YbhB/YbcL family Raf kinase inhibitor-like protein [Vicinamibacterales bacterium]